MKRLYDRRNSILRKISIIVSCIFFFLFTGGATAGITLSTNAIQESGANHLAKKVITGAGVYLRKTPGLDAKRVVITHFGDIVSLKQISPENNEWYYVETGRDAGWIKGSFLANFDDKDKLQIYLNISKHKIDTSHNFGDIIDVSNFLERVMHKSIGTSFENIFRSLYMISLRKSLSLIPKGRHTEPPYNEWILKHQNEPYWETVYQSPGASQHSSGMGWLWVDPTGKWGLPKMQALRIIRDEAGIDLKTTEDRAEETWLKGELVVMRGNNEMIYYDLLFRVGFNEGRLSGLTISYTSSDASVEDIRFLWDQLVLLAAEKLDAPTGMYKVSLLDSNYNYNSSTHTLFGDAFENGYLLYSIDWQHADTFSALSVYRNTGGSQLRSYVQFEHVAKGEPVDVDKSMQVDRPSREKKVQFSESLSIADLLEMFLQYLNSNDPTLKRFSDQAWQKVISKGPKVIPELVNLIQDNTKKHYLRAIACAAIGEIGKVDENDVSKGYFTVGAGSPAKEAIPHMLELLNDPGFSKYQQSIVYALGQLGNDAKAAVPHIVNRLKHENKQVRMISIIALGRIASNEEISLPALSAMVKNSDQEIAVEAIRSIAKFGQLSRILISQTKSNVVNPTLRMVATALLDALYSNHIEVQRKASYYLAGIAHQAENPKPALTKSLQSTDVEVRYYVAQTIKQLVTHDNSYGPILEKALEKETEKQVRRMLMDAISEL